MQQEHILQQKSSATLDQHPLQASGFEATNVSAAEPSFQLKASESPIQANGFSAGLAGAVAEELGSSKAGDAVGKANVTQNKSQADAVGALGYTQMTGGSNDVQNVVIGDGSLQKRSSSSIQKKDNPVQRQAIQRNITEGETAIHEACHVGLNAAEGKSASQLKSEADASAGGQAVHTGDEAKVEQMTSNIMSKMG